MILIVGSKHDDILYFRSSMIQKEEERLYDRYMLTKGTIFNQEVLLLYDVYTSYVSSALVLQLIEKYGTSIVFCVGKCASLSGSLKRGDLVLAKEVIFGDVDQTPNVPVRLGQLPNYPFAFPSDPDLMDFLSSSLEKRSYDHFKRADFVSTSKSFMSKSEISSILAYDKPFGMEGDVVGDSISAGVALACYLRRVPFVSAKVVERQIDEPSDIKSYAATLSKYADLGRAIVTCIGSIGSNTVLRGGIGRTDE